MNNVLVLDGYHRSALTILRSLSMLNDISITIASSKRWHPAMLSKYADNQKILPPVLEDPEIFIEKLIDHISNEAYDVILPVTDPTSLVCSKYREQIVNTGTSIGVEKWNTFSQTYDKKNTYELAQNRGIPTPETRVLYSNANADLTSIPFPSVIKPRSKSIWTESDSIDLNLISRDNYVRNPRELEEALSSIEEKSETKRSLLIQEYVEGEIRDTSILADKGEIVAYVQNRRVRTQPKSGGGYTLAESLHNQEMIEHVEDLVDELDWSGPAQFEFIYDGEKHYLIEINGRYWGSLGLAVNCGVDIPLLHYNQLAKNTNLSEKNKTVDEYYPSGIKQRWLLPGDLLWLLETIEDREYKDIPPFFSSFTRSNHDLFKLADPLPLLGKVIHLSLKAPKYIRER